MSRRPDRSHPRRPRCRLFASHLLVLHPDDYIPAGIKADCSFVERHLAPAEGCDSVGLVPTAAPEMRRLAGHLRVGWPGITAHEDPLLRHGAGASMLHLVHPKPGAVDGAPPERAGIEAIRLAAIEQYGILDTAPEPAFDRITALAADLFSTPIAILGFIGAGHVSFKSHHGLGATQADRGNDPAVPVMLPWLRAEFANGFHASVPLHDPDGYELGLLCVIDRRSRQVDEQQMRRLRALGGVVTDLLATRLAARRALAQAEITSSEVDHRAMNSLQFVASLLQLQSRASASPEVTQQLRAAANRVLSVARVHRTFSTQEAASRVPIAAHLRRLCEELSTSVGSEIRLEGADELDVPTEQVLPIGLIVNELVTNARKHAGDPISVTFRRLAGSEYELCVLDEGPGLPEGFDVSATAGLGLGMKVVNALAAQLRGQLTAHPNPAGHGSCFRVIFPVG